ncbi:MAG TPA: hypothetical protein DCR17_12760 [Verrucomicrobiales bacterium]|nr:hypothetical protein [Pedosphaera sp.]HAO67541.1 hypothetical protein [Verrucomicrobiales bacterium]HAQ99302.1 hypothetical protein [Verrucomicrobiales bacterium]HBP55094.1 hypothetical protein [Verrucomicrobiales bacterium]HCP38492.1 hypothetical protein [Verrucomicrobiales bacterium]
MPFAKTVLGWTSSCQDRGQPAIVSHKFMTPFIKSNWPLIGLTVLAAIIMGIIVDKKRNELPGIREEMRQEKLERSQAMTASVTNQITRGNN